MSNPAVPTEAGYHDTPDIARSVAVGAASLRRRWNGGLRIIDVSVRQLPEAGF